MEQGKRIESDKGTPQGGLISPILANVYLHYVLDMWFEIKIKKQCEGEAYMIRYADDTVYCFQYKEEAYKFYEALKERLAKFKLEIAEEKTRIIEFGRFARRDVKNRNGGKPETFDFLGFTHICGKTKAGKFIVIHKTSSKKLKVKKQIAKAWIKENMHEPVGETIKKLNAKLNGHYRYYGITYNGSKLTEFYRYIERELYCRLKERSQKSKFNWDKYHKILEIYPLVRPKIYVQTQLL